MLCGALVFLVGCGTDQLREKKVYGDGYQILKCDFQVEDNEDLKTSYLQIVRDINESKIVETSLNLEFDYTNVLKDDKSGVGKKTMHSALNLMCDTFEKQGYVDCYYSADEYIYTITMGMDSKKLGEGIVEEDSALEDIKSGLEAQKEVPVSNCKIN